MPKKEVEVKSKYEEAVENLESQRTHYLKEDDRNKVLALKAEGALEVLKQLEEEPKDDSKSTDWFN